MKCPFCIKVCSKCKRILVAYEGNFTKHKTCKYGFESRCKECRKEYNKSDKGKEVNAKAQAKYQKSDKGKQAQAKYWKSDKGKQTNAKGQAKHYENNPELYFNRRNKRRQLEENQGRGITNEQWLDMMDFFEWKCAYSGEILSKETRSIDHIIALTKGGLNEPWNCVPMLKSYNKRKQAKDINEWYITQHFYSEERLNKIYEWQEYAYNKYYEELL